MEHVDSSSTFNLIRLGFLKNTKFENRRNLTIFQFYERLIRFVK